MHSSNTLLANARAMVEDWGHDHTTILLSLSPLSHHIATVALAEARQPSFQTYVQQVADNAKALAEGPLDMVRGGTGENEEMLKNAQKEYWNEHDEIAKYTAIETLAESVGDKETAQLARSIRRDEERMAKFLDGQIKTLTKAVVTEEIPAKERNGGRRRTTSRSTTSSSSRSGGRRSS